MFFVSLLFVELLTRKWLEKCISEYIWNLLFRQLHPLCFRCSVAVPPNAKRVLLSSKTSYEIFSQACFRGAPSGNCAFAVVRRRSVVLCFWFCCCHVFPTAMRSFPSNVVVSAPFVNATVVIVVIGVSANVTSTFCVCCCLLAEKNGSHVQTSLVETLPPCVKTLYTKIMFYVHMYV